MNAYDSKQQLKAKYAAKTLKLTYNTASLLRGRISSIQLYLHAFIEQFLLRKLATIGRRTM